MSTPTKPERVEVGQRWQWCESQFWTLTGVEDGGWTARDKNGERGFFDKKMLDGPRAVYLGPATPGTAPMAANTDGSPAACVRCGGEKAELGFMCAACFGVTAAAAGGDGSFMKYVNEWNAGSRDFPRQEPGTATVTPGPCRRCTPAYACDAHQFDRPDVPASEPPASPTYGRLVGELRAPDGTPRSALEAIQVKREPEPWLPSCDIDCDIPDADEGWRR